MNFSVLQNRISCLCLHHCYTISYYNIMMRIVDQCHDAICQSMSSSINIRDDIRRNFIMKSHRVQLTHYLYLNKLKRTWLLPCPTWIFCLFIQDHWCMHIFSRWNDVYCIMTWRMMTFDKMTIYNGIANQNGDAFLELKWITEITSLETAAPKNTRRHLFVRKM